MTLILSGCMTVVTPKKIIINGDLDVKIDPVLPIDLIDKKILILDDLLTNNKVLEKDRVTIANLISDYHKIKSLSQDNPSLYNYKELIMILFNNLSVLDEDYFLSNQVDTDENHNKAISDLSLQKQGVFKKFLAKDYKSVITECNELEKTYGKEVLTYEIGVLLALSYAKEGKLPEAITTGDKIINEMDGYPDLIQLKTNIIQWRFDTGEKEAALKEYQKLIENMNERQSILDNTANKINSQNKKPAEKQYQDNSKDNSEGIKTATKLIEEEDYESAIIILNNMQNNRNDNPEIKKQKDIAVERFINKERNRAAKIFLAAKKTSDVNKKEELLFTVKNILNGLIDNYPSAEMIDKVKNNLEAVNNELNKIGK